MADHVIRQTDKDRHSHAHGHEGEVPHLNPEWLNDEPHFHVHTHLDGDEPYNHHIPVDHYLHDIPGRERAELAGPERAATE